MQGSPTDLLRNGVDLMNLVGNNLENKMEEMDNSGAKKRRQLSSGSQSNESIDCITMNVEDSAEDDETHGNDRMREAIQMEASSKGKIKGSISIKYFKASGHWTGLFLVVFLIILTQFLGSSADYWVSIW